MQLLRDPSGAADALLMAAARRQVTAEITYLADRNPKNEGQKLSAANDGAATIRFLGKDTPLSQVFQRIQKISAGIEAMGGDSAEIRREIHNAAIQAFMARYGNPALLFLQTMLVQFDDVCEVDDAALAELQGQLASIRRSGIAENLRDTESHAFSPEVLIGPALDSLTEGALKGAEGTMILNFLAADALGKERGELIASVPFAKVRGFLGTFEDKMDLPMAGARIAHARMDPASPAYTAAQMVERGAHNRMN